ncbi:MAG: GTPase HflX [Phycisphaerales bacterium]|nr:GTPase HflX [Phycisphaerales bacterium]
MPQPRERTTIEVAAERAVLAALRLPGSVYDKTDPFGELRALAEQAGAQIVGELTQNLPKPVSATYIGSGKVAELKALCETLGASTIIFDHDLSPKQIANIEKETEKKVIDRSELILDIFASRATTREAQLQVELAQVEYTLPRLRAMWSHLERIVGVGGIGGIGTRGPGEQQLEIDRRLAQSKRLDLVRELEMIQARKRREVKARKAEHFTVGLVGYTNAGKSTLFNTMTAGGAYADNRLFATLMTRTREWDLGGGLAVMLSDTVGFVRDLPHNLIASFKATLDEAVHADVLLIVLDVADPAAEMQYNAVKGTLDELLAEAQKEAARDGESYTPPKRIVLLNKADRLKDNSELLIWQQKIPDAIPLCALPSPPGTPPERLPMGQGELIAQIRDHAQGQVEELEISLPFKQAKAIHLIETQGQVVDRTYDGDSVTFRVKIGRRQVEQLRAGGARIKVAGEVEREPEGWRAR